MEKLGKRILQTDDIPTLFDQISLQQDIFSACTMIASEVNLTVSDWEYVYSQVRKEAQSFPTINENQLLAEITCLQALIDSPAYQTNSHLSAVTTALTSLTSQYKDGIYDKLYRSQIGALQNYNLTSLHDFALADDYLAAMSNAYAFTNFPDQPSLAVAGELTNTIVRRISGPMLSNLTFNGTGFNLSFPSSAQTDFSVSADQVLSLVFQVYHFRSMPVGILSTRVGVSGTVKGSTWTDHSSVTVLSMTGINGRVNVTLPVYNATEFTRGAMCMHLASSKWTELNCTVLSLSNTSVTVSVSSLGCISVVPKHFKIADSDPLPFQPQDSSDQCDRYYAPAGIMVALVGATIIAGAIRFVLGRVPKHETKKKSEKVHPEPEVLNSGDRMNDAISEDLPPFSRASRQHIRRQFTPNQGKQGSHSQPGLSSARSVEELGALKQDLPPDRQLQPSEIAFQPHSFGKAAEKEAALAEPRWKQVLSGHYLLGWLLCGRQINLLLLLTVLLSELFFQGVFYYSLSGSHYEGTETSISYFFESYGQNDVFFYLWAFSITFILSLVLTTLFTPIFTKHVQRIISLVGVAICVVLDIMFIILIAILNTAVCYEYAGRWSVGFLWAFLTEELILQFIVAGYRFVLLRCCKPTS